MNSELTPNYTVSNSNVEYFDRRSGLVINQHQSMPYEFVRDDNMIINCWVMALG